ncbi:MAG: aromatic ring-hydroxylating dioxygenase subunit alpha [Pseudomonadales bacterium]
MPSNPDYPGLRSQTATLPASWYLDAEQFQRELDAIWYRQWQYVCRAEDVAAQGEYQTIVVGTQNVIVLRDEKGGLQAYFNTCRHRGSVLLTEPSGTLGKATRILCPYHRWAYSSQGDLLATGSGTPPAGFDASEHGLYSVAVEEWGGFVFINLDSENTLALGDAFDEYSVSLDNWPLNDMRRGDTFETVLNCNWKLFWENFNECLHCPNLHPDLCEVVPIYKRGIMEAFDDPAWKAGSSAEPSLAGGIAQHADTWAWNGRSTGHHFSELSEQERKVGHNYAVLLPSMFIVAHVDHVRTVQLLPLSADKTRLRADWYFPQAALDDATLDIAHFTSFAKQVIDEDGGAAELNQQGLANLAHTQGSLMAEEYDVHRFQQWVRQCLLSHTTSQDLK